MIAKIWSAVGTVIEPGAYGRIDSHVVVDQDRQAVWTDAIAARPIDQGSGAEILLDQIAQPPEFVPFERLGQVAGKAVKRGDFLLEGRVHPGMELYADLCASMCHSVAQGLCGLRTSHHRPVDQVDRHYAVVLTELLKPGERGNGFHRMPIAPQRSGPVELFLGVHGQQEASRAVSAEADEIGIFRPVDDAHYRHDAVFSQAAA